MNSKWPAKTETILQHLGEERHLLGAVAPPIFQTSLFVFETSAEFERSFDYTNPDWEGFNYSRIGNPTLAIVEQKIAALEHCEAAKVFSSGMAAISAAIFAGVKAGGHVVCVDTAYGPTKQFLLEYLPRFRIETTLVEGGNTEEVLNACRPETSLIYLESPSTFFFRIQDLESIAAFARSRGICTVADNSYCSPVFQNPADFGIDVVVHSASKYLGGHSDIIAGAIATSLDRMNRMLVNEIPFLGAALAPFPAWLMIRGMRTLALRMAAHERAGNTIAQWLTERPEVKNVYHAGSRDHSQRALIDKQMRGSGGLLSFEPRRQDKVAVMAFADALKIFQMGVSWGGFESLIVPIQAQPMDWTEPRFILRLFCGLESIDDLIADLEQAMHLL